MEWVKQINANAKTTRITRTFPTPRQGSCESDHFLTFHDFEPDMFFFYLLPPIILEAGCSMAGWPLKPVLKTFLGRT